MDVITLNKEDSEILAANLLSQSFLQKCLAASLFIFLYFNSANLVAVASAEKLPTEEISQSALSESDKAKWLLPEITSIPMTVHVIDDKMLAGHDARKVAASLVERKRLIDRLWNSPKEEPVLSERPFNSVELISWVPEQVIDSVIKEGLVTGHELAQDLGKDLFSEQFIREALALPTSKERIRRLIDDAKFFTGARAQWLGPLKMYRLALDLAKSADEQEAIKELEGLISSTEIHENDPSMQQIRSEGWKRRAYLEETHLKIQLGDEYHAGVRNMANSLRPKYGIVNCNLALGFQVSRKELRRYGVIELVLRDELKWRSTFSYGDSSHIDKVNDKASCVDTQALEDFGLFPAPEGQIKFLETQIWGPVDITDIKEFRVPTGRDDLLEKLSKTGLPVYTYDRDSMNQSPEYIDIQRLGVGRQKLVYKGDQALEAKYELERKNRLEKN